MQSPSEMHERAPWEDEIDLRQLVETLLRRKWLIAGLIAVAVFAAGVYSYFVLPPRYEASITVTLPTAVGEDGLGMSLKGYEVFAKSPRVLEAMIQSGKLDMSPQRAAGRFSIQLDAASRLLTVRTSAQTSAEARQLASLWHEAFEQEVAAYVRGQFDRLLAVAQQDVAEAEERFTAAQMSLTTFDQESLIGVNQARLSRLSRQIADDELRLQELRELSIPVDMVRLHLLEESIGEVANPADVSAVTVLNETAPFIGLAFNGAITAHPLHELVITRARLAAHEEAVQRLEESIELLHTEVAVLREETTALQAARDRLRREVEALDPPLARARTALFQLESTERRLPQLTAVPVVADPILPESPVAPRKMLNMALAGFLAAFVGVGLALFQEFWNGQPRA